MTIRVLVADDQAVVRQGVVLLLSTSADIEVTGEASDGQQALRMVLDLKPDVALVDLRMPGLDGAPDVPLRIYRPKAAAGPWRRSYFRKAA